MDAIKNWIIEPSINDQLKQELSAYPPIVQQLLVNRGLTTVNAARQFFSSDWELNTHDPFSFRHMKAAIEMIILHLKAGNKIAIAGDYDADGVTASAVLYKTILNLGGNVEVWIPSRLGEGYGLSKKIIDQVIAAGAKLLITVDNGIRAKNETAYARTKDIDVIVTDHHMSPEIESEMAEGLVIDPILADELYPFKFLAGVGVAFKLVEALVAVSKLNENQKDRLKSQVLDLVAIGTIADCVSLTGENRSLVRRGLEEINKQSRPGLRSLIAVAQIRGQVEEWHVGWQLSPRLNVAGRLEHANLAFKLLTTDDQKEADELARRLNEQNILRQTETAHIVEYCEKTVETSLKNDKVIVLLAPDLFDESGEKWLEGIIGLVAGRICEKYNRPTLVICLSEGQIKGSGRSVEPIDIVALLDEAKDKLLRYGGHKMACGFTVKNKNNLTAFVDKIRTLGQENICDEMLLPKLKIDAEVDLAQVNGQLADSLEKFAPFGQANSAPLFLTRNVSVMDIMPLGADGQHFKLRFGSLWAIAFNVARKEAVLALGQKVDIVYTVEWNEYNNYKNLQLKLVDWRISI